MNQDKIVVVMGGPSTEAEISRQTGSAILKALQSKGYNAEGMELNPPTFAEDIKKSGCAIVFNALHGKFGEDGVLQGTLDMLGIPYTLGRPGCCRHDGQGRFEARLRRRGHLDAALAHVLPL